MTAACRRGARGGQSGSQRRMRGLTQGPSRVQPRWARGGCLAAASPASAWPKGDPVRCRLAAVFAVHAAAAAVLHAARHLRGTRPPQSPGRRTVAPWAGRDERSVTVLPGRRVSGSLRNGPWPCKFCLVWALAVQGPGPGPCDVQNNCEAEFLAPPPGDSVIRLDMQRASCHTLMNSPVNVLLR